MNSVLTDYIGTQIEYGLNGLNDEHGTGEIKNVNFLEAGKGEFDQIKYGLFVKRKKFRYKLKKQAVTIFALKHQITVEYS